MDTTIIIKPYITEKSMTNAIGGWYTFVVKEEANKAEIAHAVSAVYGVTVTDVRTVRVQGKMKRAGRRQQMTMRPSWKKAMVRLLKGQTIEAFQLTENAAKA